MPGESSEREKIKAVFLELDENGNGYLDENEFSMALKGFGLDLNASESSDIFRSIDTSGDGRIIFDEFYDYFLENILSQKNSALLKAFAKADTDGSGTINFKELSEFLQDRHLSLDLDQILTTFDKACKDELSFEDIQCMSFLNEIGVFQDSNEKLEAQLKSRFEAFDPQILKERIEKRWQKFESFRRQGITGHNVMTGGEGIVKDIVPGEYQLGDLAFFRDLPKVIPKMTIVKGVSWESSKIPDTPGNLVFPRDFSGNIEAEIASNELLGYYGCTFANRKSEKVFIPYRHAVQDFTYEDDYLIDYVERKKGGAGLERHGFSHIDCPLDEDSGFIILGKLDKGEIHLTAFKIPRRQTLYVPGNCIHSNDYLKGTWRTMLSDETNIDHVYLKRKSIEDERSYLESFTLTFSL
jgi:Ca2+-binding EF-hand superfamily protein